MVSTGHVGGARSSGIVSSAADMLGRDECGAWDDRSWWSVQDVYVFGSGRRGKRRG